MNHLTIIMQCALIGCTLYAGMFCGWNALANDEHTPIAFRVLMGVFGTFCVIVAVAAFIVLAWENNI